MTTTGVLIYARTHIKLYTNNTIPTKLGAQLGVFTAGSSCCPSLNVSSDGQHVIARAVTTATLDKNGTELICRDGFFMDKDVYIQCASVIPNLYTLNSLITLTFSVLAPVHLGAAGPTDCVGIKNQIVSALHVKMTPIQNGGYFRLKMNNRMYLCCLEFVSRFNYYSLLTNRLLTDFVTIAKSVMCRS